MTGDEERSLFFVKKGVKDHGSLWRFRTVRLSRPRRTGAPDDDRERGATAVFLFACL